MTGPAAGWLDGRLHLQHGPIDLVIEAFGPADEVSAAYRQAWAAFRPVLDGLVAVLPTLRMPVTEIAFRPTAFRPEPAEPPLLTPRIAPGPRGGCVKRARPAGAGRARSGAEAPDESRIERAEQVSSGQSQVADPSQSSRPHPGEAGGGRPPDALLTDWPAAIPLDSPAARMIAAAAAHAPAFVTPMAAVAGAVADHVLAAMTEGRRLERAYVNNGGDAALSLSPGAEMIAAGGPNLSARIRIGHESPVRGIATSGWRGRSQSLGIADAVTVLARTAAEADAAATLVANAVDLPGHPAVTRRRARELAPDSDLGDRKVTVAVGPLAPGEVARALSQGRAAAERMRREGLIAAGALWLGGECVLVGRDVLSSIPPADKIA